VKSVAKISIIGSGNVAQQLAPALKRCGYSIHEVCSRNAIKGKQLSTKVRSSYQNDLSKVEDTGGVIIIAVKDDAIYEVVKKLPSLKNSLVIHTSGGTDISVLKIKFKNCGVIWQVQTIKARSKTCN
jgi:pyrroline-5-carboxylate reductase